jgi:hypothetical protein
MSKKPLTELVDADIRRVDAVKGPANGTRFLIAKQSAGLVSPDAVRDLIAEPPPGDTYVDVAGQVLKAADHTEAPPTGDAITKETAMATPAETTPAGEAGTPDDLKGARAILKRAKLAKRASKLEAKLAKAKKAATPAPADEPDGDEADASEPVEKVAKPVSLRKARDAAKAAKLEKRAARDRIAVAKAQATLAKIGRRNSSPDLGHIDAADSHLAALGATAHQPGNTGTPVAADLTKAATDQVDGIMELIKTAVGSSVHPALEAIRGELAQQSEQLAKVAKMPMPGGPRVVLDRDGSIVGAPAGETGLSFEQAALAKAAERFPQGSVERETLQKIGATSAIKELMLASQQR